MFIAGRAEIRPLLIDNLAAFVAGTPERMQFIVRKGEGRAMRWPRAEDAANYYVMGIDLDLDSAHEDADGSNAEASQGRLEMTDEHPHEPGTIPSLEGQLFVVNDDRGHYREKTARAAA